MENKQKQKKNLPEWVHKGRECSTTVRQPRETFRMK